jgi:hypothetical protein
MAQQAIEVFVAPPFPRMMWIGKIAHHPESVFNLLVRMEFRSIVKRDSLEQMGFLCNYATNCLDGKVRCPVGKFCNPGQTGFSFYQSQNALMLVFAHNRIGFPMAKLKAGID